MHLKRINPNFLPAKIFQKFRDWLWGISFLRNTWAASIRLAKQGIPYSKLLCFEITGRPCFRATASNQTEIVLQLVQTRTFNNSLLQIHECLCYMKFLTMSNFGFMIGCEDAIKTQPQRAIRLRHVQRWFSLSRFPRRCRGNNPGLLPNHGQRDHPEQRWQRAPIRETVISVITAILLQGRLDAHCSDAVRFDRDKDLQPVLGIKVCCSLGMFS